MKGFERSSRGGKFRRQDFGDLGLRALKSQQDEIIAAEKVQQSRAKQINNEFARDIRGVHIAEAENRQTLQNFEDKLYQNRREAIKLRGKREVEAINARAADLDKESKKWQTLSTTGAANLGKIASGLITLGEKMSADQALEAADESGLTDALIERDTEFNAEASNPLLNAWTQASMSGDEQAADYIKPIWDGSNHRRDGVLAGRFLNQIDGLGQDLEDFAQEMGIPLTAKNIGWIYTHRLRELKQKFRFSNSEGYKKLRSAFITKAHTRQMQLARLERADKGSRALTESLSVFKNDRSHTNLMSVYNVLLQYPYKEGDRIVNLRPGDIVPKLMENAAEIFTSKEEALDFILDGPAPGSIREFVFDKGVETEEWVTETGKPGTLRDRFKGKGLEPGGALDALEEELSDIYDKYNVKAKAAETKKLQSAALDARAEIDKQLAEDPDYYNTEEGWLEGSKLLKTYEKYNGLGKDYDPAIYLREKMGVLKPGSTDPTSIQYRAKSAIRDNDFNELASIWPRLSKEEREKYTPSYQNLSILREANMGYEEVKKHAQTALKEHLDYASIDELMSSSSKKMVKVLQENFNYEFNSLNKKDYEGRPNWEERMVQDAWTNALKDLNAETGLFKRVERESGERTTHDFVHTVGEEKYRFNKEDKLTLQQIKDLGKESDTHTYKEVKADDLATFNQNKHQLISRRDTADLAREITTERNVIIPEELKEYAHLTGNSITEVVNFWLESQGYSQRLRENVHDIAKEVSKAHGFNIETFTAYNGAKVAFLQAAIIDNGPEVAMAYMSPAVQNYLQNSNHVG